VSLATVLALAGTALPAGALADPETELRRLINVDRSERDLRPLKAARRASRLAESHSREMARAGEVFGSRNLPQKLRKRGYRFRSWSENVGCDESVRSVHRRLMRQRSSRRAILFPRFRRVGLGVARSEPKRRICNSATVWVTEIFFG
jgi:uncharacterized protein YkwD